MSSYVRETDEEMGQKSNRTFQRITKSLSSEVAVRYGYDPPAKDLLLVELNRALATKDREAVVRLATEQLKRDAG